MSVIEPSSATIATSCHLSGLPMKPLAEVMKNLPDLAALSRLFIAYPWTLATFKDFSDKIFVSIMTNISPELRNASLDVLALRSRSPVHSSQITNFIDDCLDVDIYDVQLHGPKPPLNRYPLSKLLDLIAISESIETLTESFTRDRILFPCTQRKQNSAPLSPVELHRTRRSFWRFQLCLDMCHPEEMDSAPFNDDARSKNTTRYVYHHALGESHEHVPDWLQCRGESYRPEALSRFLPNLSSWELDELDAIRFHLAQQVNSFQYLRSRDSQSSLPQPTLLLQRLVRTIDSWDLQGPHDHVLVASFSDAHPTGFYPSVWARRRDHFAASTANTPFRSAMKALQRGHPQWGWCLWDEKRLLERGSLNIMYEMWVENNTKKVSQRRDDKDLMVKEQRMASVHCDHDDCIAAQYTADDRAIARRFLVDKRMQAETVRLARRWLLRRKGE